MDIIYAAEKRSIAELLGHHVHRDIGPEEINVAENPGETGSFFIGWGVRRYVLSPAGEIVAEGRRHATQRSGASGLR
jgi:hypothetical protein